MPALPHNRYQRLQLLFQLVLLLEALAALWRGQWLTLLIALVILAITLLPVLLEKRFRLFIPPPFQLLTVAFVFASLFLGEVRGYYTRFWWWDIALHTSSGFLLGIVGFLLVHVLNEIEDTGVHMRPGFVAFFAFLFALGIGALWEIFEFTMDSLFGMNMQKPMLGDPSGLTDTMFDLVVDAIGALVISLYGYQHLKNRHRQNFLQGWISHFIQRNPRFFRRP
ncbi:MAG TPA: hypothetical protein VIN71_02500 [Pseudomonadales bacterium]